MRYLKTIARYLKWHYSLGFYHISVIYKNIFVFLFEYFSIKTLLKEFFLPWKRLSASYTGIKNISTFFETLLQNIIMRAVGVALRTAVLFVGSIIIILFIPVYPLAIFVWTISPIIIISLIISGIVLILSLITKAK